MYYFLLLFYTLTLISTGIALDFIDGILTTFEHSLLIRGYFREKSFQAYSNGQNAYVNIRDQVRFFLSLAFLISSFPPSSFFLCASFFFISKDFFSRLLIIVICKWRLVKRRRHDEFTKKKKRKGKSYREIRLSSQRHVLVKEEKK